MNQLKKWWSEHKPGIIDYVDDLFHFWSWPIRVLVDLMSGCYWKVLKDGDGWAAYYFRLNFPGLKKFKYRSQAERYAMRRNKYRWFEVSDWGGDPCFYER